MKGPSEKNPIRLVHAVIFVTWLHSAHGVEAPPSWRIEIQPASQRLDAREYLPNGSLFNREQGRMDAWQFAVGYRPEWPTVRHWEAVALRQVAQGRVNYLGLSQGGLPVVTQTQLQMARSELGLHRWFLPGATLRWSLGASVGTWEMDRNILPGLNLPLQEILRERTRGLHASGRWALPRYGAWVPEWLGAQYATYRHSASNLWVNSFGIQDLITLSPGKSRSSIVSAQLAWRLSPRHELVWYRSIERLDPAASETAVWTSGGVPTGTVRYPGAAIDLQRVGVGMRLAW